MRKLLLCLAVALTIAGCAADSQNGEVGSSAAGVAKTGLPIAQSGPAMVKRAAYASLPDRGTLLAFERDRQPVRRGAHTYHAVQLSEAHALKAAAAGKSINLPTPSGGTMRIAYQRHEEGFDGNWTWIGKTQDGLDAIITFGETAVFGRIYQRDTEALNLTMSGGRSWLVEADPSKMLDGNLGRDHESDVLIPQSVAAAVSAKKRTSAGSVATASEQALAGPADTVDVVLGFTNGLVTKYGSVANANSRLANLIAITNQAYQNSLVNPRVRLVRTVQVSYTDTNDNETALEALTGFTCTTTGCTAQTVPAELVPLRTARDQYGGDLVSLVRPFQAPQHQGCGIAWLLGGGGFTIDNTDAPFGYSIVSDGTDVDEGDGRTYFCREETLAHELGHNMGQQHNIEDAGSPPDSGSHSYSYGYREATTTGFYTVMAYRLANSSQFSINYFGNPGVNYLDTGRPTGTAAADNARSLRLTMPLVVQFRASVVPFATTPSDDINRDGKSDLLWRLGSQQAYWVMNAQNLQSSAYAGDAGTGFKLVASGDFNGDGAGDLLFTDNNTLRFWINNGSGGFTSTSSFYGGGAAGWQPYGTADINNDGRSDLLWRLGSQVAYWLMNGTTAQSTAYAGDAGTGFRPVATGDLNGDGADDLVFSDTNTLRIWINNGTGAFSSSSSFYGGGAAGWQPYGTADVNNDGRSDLLWRLNGQAAHWLMNGATVQSTAYAGDAGTGFKPVAIGDFNGDGAGDLVFSDTNNLKIWINNGSGAFFIYPSYYGGGATGWQPFNPGVFIY
jgi:hypothetical protein